MLRFLEKRLHNQLRNVEHEQHQLFYLFWECTQRCNLSCLHCGSDCVANSRYPDMPKEDFLKVLDSVNRFPHPLTTVVLTGGEPLLREDLEEIGLEIRKRGFRWGIVTNGFAYTEKRHSTLMGAGMGSVTLSFDGLQTNHNWLRNHPRSYEKALKALNLIFSTDRLVSDVVTCVNKRNINELEDIYNVLFENNARAWRMFTIAPIGRAVENEDLTLNAEEFTYLMEFIQRKRKERLLDVKFSCEGYVGKYEGKVREDYFFCRAGVNVGSVLIDGSIGACPNINRSFVQGNIYEDDFMEAWNTRFQPYRDRSWTRIGECASCKEYKFCQGNGMHYWAEKQDNVLMCHHKLIK